MSLEIFLSKNTERASSRLIGVPGILVIHVTVALGVTTYGALLDTLTGCGPTSVGLLTNIIVPVIVAVTVREIVAIIWPTIGATALFGTFLHT
ncbi:hypothetical protein P4255_08490 [Bacillus wiedmannii]|uniref:hypothetical protein n=1 Tax=Bacillus wiedmannii TaxID=1890302 RepID=UPI002E23ECF9|nr:hypothetical protein [Bacillus wiedmannii]